MNVAQIYHTALELGLARSQVEFSTIWLGRSPRYYSQLMAKQLEPSVGTLLGLSHRLGRLGETVRPELRTRLLELRRAVDQHCERRTLTDVRRRHSTAAY